MVKLKRIRVVLFILFCLLSYKLASGQVTRDLLVEYDFTEISGTVIHDGVPLVPALDLDISDGSKVEWLNPGLRVKAAIVAKTSSARTKLDPGVFFSKGITIEVWIKPLNNTQGGPARIVTFSQDSMQRNFTLGQAGEHYEQRFRTSDNPGNGNNPAAVTPATSIVASPVLQHVVYTRSETGVAAFYLNNLKVQALAIPGDGSNWDSSYGFGLFNEINYPTDTRTWLGDIFLVRIYGDDLTGAEVTSNFNAGLPSEPSGGEVDLMWDANTEPDLDGYRLYYGETSRLGPIDPKPIIDAVVAEKCKDMLGTLYDECKDSWEQYCSCNEWSEDGLTCVDIPDPPDPLCTYEFFSYDGSVDVQNVTEYTLTGLKKGVKYFLGATAYDIDNNESKFSVELEHTILGMSPVTDLIIKIKE